MYRHNSEVFFSFLKVKYKTFWQDHHNNSTMVLNIDKEASKHKVEQILYVQSLIPGDVVSCETIN